MKTQNQKLVFNSNSIVELNNNKMSKVLGGSTTFFVDWLQDQIDDAKEEMSPWI